jgi:uncharacterized protein (DUF1778 family)
MRDAAINLRAPTPEQRDLDRPGRQPAGQEPSDFMLEAACDRARSVLLDQVSFELMPRFRKFNALLDAPAHAQRRA